MAGIWSKRIAIVSALGEIVGYKSGLALTRDDLSKHLPEHQDILIGQDEQIIRIRSEAYQELVELLLYRIGNIPTSRVSYPGVQLYHKYKNDPIKSEILLGIMEHFNIRADSYLEMTKNKENGLDPTLYIIECKEQYGLDGASIAIEFLEGMSLHQHANPWSQFRSLEWKDIKELSDLFESESLQTYYGKFCDQRFIDYLYQNFERIDEINWRKFEGLAGEYFDRNGFHVEIGNGRNDDNVDIRVWSKEKQNNLPPTMLIQCKREKEKIGKVVVKALYADILEEKAESGLIVTTSSLLPGANKVCTARGYPITQANRQTLQSWLKNMRSPYSGIFLGE